MKLTNYQIRINVFDTQENAYKVVETIENLKLGYDIRILNINKGDDEIDDETQALCEKCGRLDGALHDYVCDACLILEKEKRQQEEETKFPDSQYLTTWGDMGDMHRLQSTGSIQKNKKRRILALPKSSLPEH